MHDDLQKEPAIGGRCGYAALQSAIGLMTSAVSFTVIGSPFRSRDYASAQHGSY
jgi:hypothetical protein